MYNPILMSKKNNIVSRMFDTINTMTDPAEQHLAEQHLAEQHIAEQHIAVQHMAVQVPNHLLPIKFTTVKPVSICVYQINTTSLAPFLLFLFKKHEELLGFIPCPEHKKLKYTAMKCIQSLFPENPLTYAGFYEGVKENIIIFSAGDSSSTNDSSKTHITNTDYLWATVFEIINKQKVLNYSLHPNVNNFFLANTSFLILKSPEKSIYESPMIGYYHDQQPTTVREEMDIYRKTHIPNLGKCYYLDMELQPTRHTALRVAFFAGKMLIYGENAKYYDSLCFPLNKKYIIQNYNQHCIVSAFAPLINPE